MCKDNIINCSETIQIKHKYFGLTNNYKPCPHQAKYSVTYISAVRGNTVSSLLCGVHLSSLKKRNDRQIKKFGFDSKLIIKEL